MWASLAVIVIVCLFVIFSLLRASGEAQHDVDQWIEDES